MIKGIGCDIVDLNRLSNHLDEFACKILTASEIELYNNKKTDKHKREFLGGRVLLVKRLFLKQLE